MLTREEWLELAAEVTEGPAGIALLRHGESEGNKKTKLLKARKRVPPGLRLRKPSDWRLTDKGIWQAEQAGIYIREHLPFLLPFDRLCASPYLRASETAARLGLDGRWFLDMDWRERDWGGLGRLSRSQIQKKHPEMFAALAEDPLEAAPYGGVSIANLRPRVRDTLSTWHRELKAKVPVLVCHGEFIWAMRTLLERMTPERFATLDRSKHPHHHIHNCQILIYSRINPVTRETSRTLDWMLSVCPWDLTKSPNRWMRVARPVFTAKQLLARVNRVPRILA